MLERPELRFLGRFAAFAVLFELIFLGLLDHVKQYQTYLSWNASGAAALLRLLGFEACSQDNVLILGPSRITVLRSCDALEPIVLFGIAVVLFPAAPSYKVFGVIGGLVLLQSLNFVRLASLLLSHHYRPNWFEPLHLSIWPVSMILFALVTWVLWAHARRCTAA